MGGVMKTLKCVVTFLFLLGLAFCKSSTTSETKNPPTIVYFFATPETIEKGESSTLSWSTMNAATASIDQGIGSVGAEGEQTVSPTATTTYTLTVENPDGTAQKTATITVKEIAVIVLDGTPKKSMTSYGCPQFSGYVKNVGAVIGYNCMIEFRAYSDPNRTTIIDTASGFPADLGNIEPGQRAYYEAVFFKLTSWNQVKSWDYRISWLNINLLGIMEIGMTEGWGQ
jgi:hypothetical protein